MGIASVALLGLTVLGGPSAWAQNSVDEANTVTPSATSPATATTADQAQAAAGMKALGQMMSGAASPPTLPATPHRLALMRQYMQTANVAASMKLFSALAYDQTKSQLQPSIKAMPASRQAVVMAAVAKAFHAADARRQETSMAAMADYFATRMTDEELATVVDYYSSGLGYKMLHVGLMTPDERQQIGRNMLENPALLKFAKLEFAYIRLELDRRGAATAAFQADFHDDLCRDLAEAHLQSANCLAAHR